MNERLLTIAGLIEKNLVVADVGTDHAYLPIYLLQNQQAKRLIASDIKVGPLATARRNLASCALTGAIELRLGAGLKPYQAGEVDVFVIAGMGGHTIADILADDISLARAARYLLLQPMQNRPFLRRWLYQNGFSISVEQIAREGAKFYHIIKVINKADVLPAEFDLAVAVKPLKDDNYYAYINHLIDAKQALAERLRAAGKTTEYDKLNAELVRLRGASNASDC